MANVNKDDCMKWLKWLFEMIKVINWNDIINFIFKLKIKLFIWIYNDIMKL